MPGIDDKCAWCGYNYGIHFMEPQGVACPKSPGVKAAPAGGSGWFQPVRWVKCIDASDLGKGQPALTLRKVYLVLAEDSSGYYLVNDKGKQSSFIKSRFVPTNDPNTGTSTAPVQASRPATQEVDVSDWRTWSNKTPGQCACGIARQQCDYHKDARS